MSIAHAPAAARLEQLESGGMQMRDTTLRAATEPEAQARLAAAAAEATTALESATAGEILAWAAATIPNFVVTSSFGIDSVVLLHLVATHAPGTPVVFLDTGLHFPETIAYRDTLTGLLDLDVVTIRSPLAVQAQERLMGARLFARDADTCCRLRKGLPLEAALAGADGWATGVRRGQTPSRASTPVVGTARKGDRLLVKVAPLASWSADQLAGHRASLGLPDHPLEAHGYRSVGCEPCTRPVEPDEDPRAGRWAHEPDRTECGIHVDAELGVVRTRR
ncbi:MAG TPA: phosphoadenylyl-sulfate reductase [Nitriliruptoraceae bacterium]|nr:phosphoadenylyl-sulfate reductase [Nitriliruptoraceae bacterium]